MKQFKFRLQRVQKLRERLRERRRLSHAEAVAYERRVESQIDQIEQVKAAERADLVSKMTRSDLSVDQVIAARTYEGLLNTYRQQLDRQLDQVRQVVAARRRDLVDAERDVRILEKLEEKLQHRYDAALDSAERQLMDELAGRTGNRLLETS
jgi:flagellar FliJ protein